MGTPYGDKLLGMNFDSSALLIVDTVQLHELGARQRTADGKVYVYALYGGTITAKNFVKIKYSDDTYEPWVFIETAAVADQAVAIALASGVAGNFGWFQTRGLVTGANVATSTAAGAVIIPSGTAGRCAAIANTDIVQGIGLVLTTAASNAAPVLLISPLD